MWSKFSRNARLNRVFMYSVSVHDFRTVQKHECKYEGLNQTAEERKDALKHPELHSSIDS